MWPHQRHQHPYGSGDTPDSSEHYQPQRPMHPMMGNPALPPVIPQSTNPFIHARQNHEPQQQSSHPYQQTHQQPHNHVNPHQHHQHHHNHHRQHQHQHQHRQQQEQQRQHQGKQQLQQFNDRQMTPTASSNPRASRNMAEKQRRDNLNTNISNMATLVPTVAASPRRLDKISILRLGATYLRTEYALGSGNGSFLPRRYNKLDLENFLFDALVRDDGFMLVVTSTGKIIYVGRQVEQHLGHAQADLLGQSLYNFVFPDDQEELTRNLTPSGDPMNRLMLTECSTSEDNNSNASEDSRSMRSNGMLFGEERRSFNIRMSQRAASRREDVQYECLHISGLLRPASACKNRAPGNDGKARTHHEMSTTSNDIIFVGIARMMKRRITELSLLEANKEEYVTRHLIDGRIIFCDHRISVVAGYMTDEVSGMSAFSYMHSEDVLWTIIALRQMYHRGEGFGSSCYRLKTKTGEYIYLRTHAYIEVDQDRQSFESFICVNTSVSKEEGERLTNDMKARYSATIARADSFLTCDDMNGAASDPQNLVSKVAVKDPLQLENAISHLISEFASPSATEDRSSPSVVPDTQSMKAVFMSQYFPPPAIHANKIGIKCIDRPMAQGGKDIGKCVKRETSVASPTSSTSSRQNLDTSKELEDSRNPGKSIRSPLTPQRGDKIMPETATVSGMHYGKRDDDIYNLEPSPSCASLMSDECSSRDAPFMPLSSQNQTSTTKQSPTKIHRGKPESMFARIKQESIDSTTRHEGINGHSSKNSTNKRSNIDDTTVMSSTSKKRRGSKTSVNRIANESSNCHYDRGPQMSNFSNYQEERAVDRDDSRVSRIDNARSNGQTNDLVPQYDNDSPCSSLHDLNIDYQPLNPSNVELSVYGDDFPDLHGDSLLGSSLADNPDFTKIFDDLGPVIAIDKNLEERMSQQFPNNDQAVSEGLKRTHMELANRITMQKNQLCVLEHELETPAMQSQYFKPRETLIELRAEHTKNTRLLKTIQQDHLNNMQTNTMKHNIGV